MSLKIKHSAIVTGSRLVDNDYYKRCYKDSDKDIEHFLVDVMGKNKRYHCDETSENTLTLGASACDKVLKESDLSGEDIDLIVFCSQFPEFTLPSQSCIIHNHIKAKKKCVTLDLNVNCLGMLRGLDVANRYFNDKGGEFKYALLIGADYMSVHTNKIDPAIYSTFSDGACAMILEYTDEDNKGIIGSSNMTISEDVYGCMFPECGISSISNYDDKNALKISWTNPEIDEIVLCMKDTLDDVLKKHNLTVDDIDWFCPSQFSMPLLEESRKKCNIPKEKTIYVGDKYGYTGNSCPFFAYTEGTLDGRIKKGDLVCFSSVGIGHTICSMLVQC